MQLDKMYTSIDAHVAGEGYRVIIHSPLQLAASDRLKTGAIDDPFVNQAKRLLLREPRGHIGLKGCVILPSRQADYHVTFLHQELEDYFSYSGLMASLTVLLETGQIPVTDDGLYTVETNRGIFRLSADFQGETVQSIEVSLPQGRILEETEEMIHIETGNGRNYSLYPLPSSIPELEPAHLPSIMRWGKHMTQTLKDQLYDGIALIETETDSTFRSVTFEADGMILRSPGFDTTCAILRKQENKDRTVSQITNRSIFQSEMQASRKVDGSGEYTIHTQPFITGEHRFVLDPEDPLANGFLLK